MLRTVIEQWARTKVHPAPPFADQLMDEYMATLPAPVSGNFPSMRNLYGTLSENIHGAIGSDVLFETAKAQIIEHFDVRRMFKLDEPAGSAAVPASTS
jgi:hypothetical protein